MSQIVGIDLGTTYSATALVRDGVPQIIAHGDERIVPSMVGLTPQGGLLVGTPARNQYVLHPDLTVRSVKRLMGSDTMVKMGERDYRPQDISALILRELRRSLEVQLGEPVTRAVITVPAYFSDAARLATREAGEIAGFTVERIINEPTAAALAYGLDRSGERQMVAVYDLGGGTFDVSIIELDAGVVEVRASHGNTQLGGDDFDERLVVWLAEQFKEEHGHDPRDDRRAFARLTRTAEQVKIALSTQPIVQVREEYLLTVDGRPLHLELEVNRETFEGLISDLIEQTLASFDSAMQDAGLEFDKLDKILLVGGSTRIPLVWRMLRDHSSIEPTVAVNPDEAVALGAAVQAAIIAGQPLDAILVDVTPHSLGIEVADILFGQLVPDRYSVIIQRNTTIPTTRAEIYSALHPEQRSIELKIFQGEHATASRNTLLGSFLFENLRPPQPMMPPQITVQFDFDVDGILHVSAVDRGSGKEARTSVKAAHVQLGPAELAGLRAELDELGPADWDVIDEDEDDGDDEIEQVPEMSLETIGLLTRARRALGRAPDNSTLQEAISALESAVQRDDQTALAATSDALLDLLYDLDAD